ncbi:MAG: hypothetical protein IT317_23285, partial [Anaerolineales bacterium]|nr:hypothetical protein [Anaerolineales bacterium]
MSGRPCAFAPSGPARGLLLLTALALAACAGPRPVAGTPTPALLTPAPATPTAELTATIAPAETSAAAATPTPARAAQLTICLAGEPQSLYRYARPEPNREHILAALYEAPIDQTGGVDTYGYAATLLERLPSPATDDAALNTVSVAPGSLVVDALDRVTPLAEGVRLRHADGRLFTYSGDQPARLPQWAVTFRLRPGLTWSDGAPLTAADSVFAYNLGGDVDSQDPLRFVAERTAAYAAADELTVVWTGLPGYLDPLYFTRFWPPLPAHLWAGQSPAEIADSDRANRAPLGWGPFVIEQWTPGVELTLTRNPAYWRAAEGLPRVERLVYRFVPDAAAQLAALEAGRCDLAPSGPGLTALADQAAAAGLDARVTPGPALQWLLFNTTTLPDPGARRALAHCLDRAALAPAPSLAAGGSHLREATSDLAAFDPAQGRARLAEAGWADVDGAPRALRLVGGPQDNAAVLALLSAVQTQLQTNCGVAVSAQALTRGELTGDWPDGVVFGGQFDLALFTWQAGPAPPCALFLSDQIPSESNPSGANATGYSSAAFDEACRAA